MTDLHHILKPDYDKRVGRGEQSFFCYSAKKMRRLYPEKNFTVVGEVKKGKTLDNRETPKKSKKEERRIGQLSLNGKPLGMFPVGEHNRFTHSRVGYVCVGDNTFVAMHASRIPFLILFPTLLASIALLVFLIISI